MQIEDKRKASTGGKLGLIIEKIKNVKNIQIIVAILIIAVALIIYSNVISKKSVKSSSQSGNTVMTEEETRLAAVLSQIDGAGQVSAMITKNDGNIVGVIVIAQGADNITVRLRLLDAAATALGVNKNIVSVYSKSG